ncbi:MAG: head GIN domain-containing protein [Ferruginibacter sp.]
MKKFILIVLGILSLAACRYRSGSGNIITEKRSTAEFTGVIVAGGFEVEIKTGPPQVKVEADDNLMRYVETKVVNGQLKIRMEDVNVHDAHLKIYITAPEINTIKASAAADVIAKDVLISRKINLQVSGGSGIEAGIDAPETSVEASSGGSIKLSGRTRDLKVTCSSGSVIKAKSLLSENTTVNASSGGAANVHASVTLEANASSGGDISYSGAANVRKSVSSGGTIKYQ